MNEMILAMAVDGMTPTKIHEHLKSVNIPLSLRAIHVVLQQP